MTTATLTPTEATRIAREYGATVPDGVEVQRIPRGASGLDHLHTAHWKEQGQAAHRVRLRRLKFEGSNKKDQAIREMRAQGMDWREIAARLGMSYQGVYARGYRMGIVEGRG